MRTTVAAILFLFPCYQAVAQLSDQATAEIQRMHWADADGAKLAASKSSIVSLPGFRIIIDAEAKKFREIIDGRSDSHEEADALNTDLGSELVYEWFPVGYIKSDDWGDIDVDDFLAQMRKNDAEANQIRAQKGLPTITTTGWRQQPQLNLDTHTVLWSINGIDSSGSEIVNFVALKLGRYGFEKLIWIVEPANANKTNDLLLAIANHRFNDGARYTDYVASTDHAAEYGIAGLVAGALGVKLLKVAGIGAAIIGLKKFAILLLLPFIYGWRKLAAIFKRKPNQIV
jgi:uncharacterized membrane-anchored protein